MLSLLFVSPAQSSVVSPPQSSLFKMRQKSGPVKESAEKVVKEIRRMTRRKFSAEEKIRP